MKRIFLICVSVIALLSFTSCNKEKDKTDKEVIESIASASTLPAELIVSAEEYVGEYNSYSIDEPNLEIQRNKDGTYTIQIYIFRLIFLSRCVGEYTDEGIVFTTDEYAKEYTGKPFQGKIILEDDIATVIFTSPNWKKYSSVKEYKYYKASNEPKIPMFDL